MPAAPTIVWFRNDLRLDDHAALCAVVDRGGPVIPLFIWSPEDEEAWAPGGASRVWLHHSLNALDQSLREVGSRLIIRMGDATRALEQIIDDTGATSCVWSRRYEPHIIERDARIKRRLKDRGVTAESFNSALLHEPWEIETKDGRPYQVFTPFWRACLANNDPCEPLAAPRSLRAPSAWPRSITIDQLQLLPTINWHAGIEEAWTPGERSAIAALKSFLALSVAEYASDRDRPDVQGTSRLSPHLHFGEISPRRIWHEAAEHVMAPSKRRGDPQARDGAEKFLAEVGWREFAHHLLYHFPKTAKHPLREQFADFPWRKDQRALKAWQRGETGYPIVDAGMRQLWHTGWMHNRVRMIVASFLVKHLLLPWQEGAKWFWDTLVDADLASNTLGWQWTAGCGADAAPYFRIFNPITQGEKFDAQGVYVRRWVPELKAVPNEYIHKPWEAPPAMLRNAGIVLGTTYPKPIVDHREGRERALDALASIKTR